MQLENLPIEIYKNKPITSPGRNSTTSPAGESLSDGEITKILMYAQMSTRGI